MFYLGNDNDKYLYSPYNKLLFIKTYKILYFIIKIVCLFYP